MSSSSNLGEQGLKISQNLHPIQIVKKAREGLGIQGQGIRVRVLFFSMAASLFVIVLGKILEYICARWSESFFSNSQIPIGARLRATGKATF